MSNQAILASLPVKRNFPIWRVLGIVLLLFLAVCAVMGPALIGGDPAKQSLLHTLQMLN